MRKPGTVLLLKMSSRGFLLRMPDDDSYDPEMRPISPNIIISRSDYIAAHDGGKISHQRRHSYFYVFAT